MFSLLLSFCFSVIVGIDIGTDTMKISALSIGKNVDMILNRYSKRQTPSMISFESKSPIASDFVDKIDRRIGLDAFPALVRNSSAVIRGIPLITGKENTEELQKILESRHYDFSLHSNRVNGVSISVVIAMLLEECLHYAEEQLSIQNIKDIVIVLPAYSTDAMKEQYANAATMIGLNVMQITDDRSSLGIIYALERGSIFKSSEKKVAFVDCGAGSTTVIGAKFYSTAKSNFDDLEYRWDDTVGGYDFDVAIAEALSKKYKLGNVSQLLISESQKVKHALTISDAANISSEATGDRILFSRKEFDECAKPILDRIDALLSTVTGTYDYVELIGGASRIPAVKDLIAKRLGTTSRMLNSDEAIVVGATYIGAMLSRSVRLPSINHNIISAHEISIQTPVKQLVLFKSGSPINKAKTAKLDTKTNFSIVYTSKVPLGASKTVGTWDLIFDGEIPKVMRAIITIKIDDNAMISIEESKVAEKANKKALLRQLTLNQQPSPLDESEFVRDMNKALIASFSSHSQKEGRFARAKNDFESLIFSTKNSLEKEFAKIISEDERNTLIAMIKDNQQWLENGNDVEDTQIMERHKKLFNYLQPIKQRASEREKLKEAVELLRKAIKDGKKKIHGCSNANELRSLINGVNDWLKTKVRAVTHNEGTLSGESVDQKRFFLETQLAKCKKQQEEL